MHLKVYKYAVCLVRDTSDPTIQSEDEVTRTLLRLLNEWEGSGWSLIKPSDHGLTSCTQGVYNAGRKVVYWHERYQIELATEAYNNGAIWYQIARET